MILHVGSIRGGKVDVDGTTALMIAHLIERATRINGAHAGTVTINFSHEGRVSVELREVFSGVKAGG